MHNVLLGFILVILIIGFFPTLAIAALGIAVGLLAFGIVGFIIYRIVKYSYGYMTIFRERRKLFHAYRKHHSIKSCFLLCLKVASVPIILGSIIALLIWGGPVAIVILSNLPDMWGEFLDSWQQSRNPRVKLMGPVFLVGVTFLAIVLCILYICIIFFLFSLIRKTAKSIDKMIFPFDIQLCAEEKELKKDKKETEKWFRHIVELGYAKAQYIVGMKHFMGVGIPRNHAKAKKWFYRAAEQKQPDAQFALGVIYEMGSDVKQDHCEAVRWFRCAAEQGHADAQYRLGMMYGNGQGVEKSQMQAIKWCRLAAKQGNVDAQTTVGTMYNNYVDNLHDGGKAEKWWHQIVIIKQFVCAIYRTNAIEWFRRASEQGDASAHFKLGFSHIIGVGTSQDYKEGYILLSLAAMNGYEEATTLLDKVREKLAPDVLKDAQQEVEQRHQEIQSKIK